MSSAALDRREYTHRVLIAIGLVSLVVLLMLLLWAGADVALLIFGGILFALFLRGLSELLQRVLPLSDNWSLGVVLGALAALLGLGAWLLGSALVEQLTSLIEAITSAWTQAQDRLTENEWGKRVAENLPDAEDLTTGRNVNRMTSLFSSGVGAVFSFVVIGFTGIYLAFDPQLYRRGLIQLAPRDRRERTEEVLDALGKTLRGWLVSQAFSMVVVGTATTIGLLLLGTPLPFGLGLVAFVFTFVPYVGPLAAAVPAILVAMTIGPMHAVYVGLLYFGVQMVEGNLLTPLIQQRMVKLAPGLTIISQVLMGVLLGTPGVVFATPLAACAQVLVKKLYVEDTLGDSNEKEPSSSTAPSPAPESS